MKISRKKIMAASGNIRLVNSGGNQYFTTYTVFDGRDKIGLLEDHHTGVKNRYYVAWHLYDNPGPNQAGNTKMFYSKDEAIQWIIDNLGEGDLRKDVGAATKTRKTPIKADAADVYENSDDTFEEIFYDICINDNHNGNYYEREEDAIEIANQYAADPTYADDEITVVLEHYMTNARGEIIDYFDDNGAVVWSSNDAIYDSTKITCAADANGYEDLALALGDAIKRLAADEDHLNNFLSYLTQHFPEWLRKYANTPEGLVSEFREFANMNF